MNIIVCVKAVPGSTEVKMDPATNTIVRDGGASVINPFDAAALEVALRLKDDAVRQGLPCRVAVLSMGIPTTAELLRDCIARGADDALLLSDRAFAGADTLATTYGLACGVRRLGGADLVLCGKMAVDGDTAQIGPELAGALDAPCIAGVTEVLEVASGRVCARREVDGGAAVAEAPLPAVLTVAKDVAQLRMARIAGVMAAEGARIEVFSARQAGADPARIGRAGSPTQVVRSFVPKAAASGISIEGSVGEQADAAAALLKEMGI